MKQVTFSRVCSREAMSRRKDEVDKKTNM